MYGVHNVQVCKVSNHIYRVRSTEYVNGRGLTLGEIRGVYALCMEPASLNYVIMSHSCM